MGVIFDLETTSLDVNTDIVQISFLEYYDKDTEEHKKYDIKNFVSKLINVNTMITEGSSNIHHITKELLDSKVPNYFFTDFWNEYKETFIGNRKVFSGYNVEFDVLRLANQCAKLNLEEPNFGMVSGDISVLTPSLRNKTFCAYKHLCSVNKTKRGKLVDYADSMGLYNDTEYEELAKKFNIQNVTGGAHDASYDVYLTYNLIKKLGE